jgi:hypothetical protein
VSSFKESVMFRPPCWGSLSAGTPRFQPHRDQNKMKLIPLCHTAAQNM